MARNFLGPVLLGLSMAIYLAAFVGAASEYGPDHWTYEEMCQFNTCWKALYQVWAIAIAFGVFSFVASAALAFLQIRPWQRVHRFLSAITIGVLLLIAAMWLAVILIGWVPLHINLRPGFNALPLWDSYGNGIERQLNSDDPTPTAGMFHYAIAWYQAAVVDAPSNASPGLSDFQNHGHSALAAVVLCNIAFAWSVLMVPLMLIHLRNIRNTQRSTSGVLSKERAGSV